MKTWWMMALAEIPELLPMREEIAPSFLEKHGWWPVIGIAAGVIALAVTATLLLRRRKAVGSIPAEVLARRALEALRGRAEDTVLVPEVSAIVRRYVIGVFVPAHDELTTDELMRLLQNDGRLKSGTRAALAGFLKDCDVQKFGPGPMPMAPGLVERALELLRWLEADRLAAAPSPATLVGPA